MLINRLFHMDDLKVFAKNDNGLRYNTLATVKKFRVNITKEFSRKLCAEAVFKRGKLAYEADINLSNKTEIRELAQKEECAYLEISEGYGIHHTARKKNRKEFPDEKERSTN